MYLTLVGQTVKRWPWCFLNMLSRVLIGGQKLLDHLLLALLNDLHFKTRLTVEVRCLSNIVQLRIKTPGFCEMQAHRGGVCVGTFGGELKEKWGHRILTFCGWWLEIYRVGECSGKVWLNIMWKRAPLLFLTCFFWIVCTSLANPGGEEKLFDWKRVYGLRFWLGLLSEQPATLFPPKEDRTWK